jgi:hypothetical protein
MRVWTPEQKARKKVMDVEWRRLNRAKYIAYNQKWLMDHPWLLAFNVSVQRARSLDRMPPWADRGKIKLAYRFAAYLQHETGVKMHVDHIAPYCGATVSGLHVHENLQVIPAWMHYPKSSKEKAECRL